MFHVADKQYRSVGLQATNMIQEVEIHVERYSAVSQI